MNHKTHIKSVFNTLVSSYIIYWMYIGLTHTPYVREQIETIKFFSSYTANWNFGTYLMFFGLNVFMTLMILYLYFNFLVPVLTMTFSPNLYDELKDKKIEMFKIHLYQVIFTLGIYLIFSYQYSN